MRSIGVFTWAAREGRQAEAECNPLVHNVFGFRMWFSVRNLMLMVRVRELITPLGGERMHRIQKMRNSQV